MYWDSDVEYASQFASTPKRLSHITKHLHPLVRWTEEGVSIYDAARKVKTEYKGFITT